MKKFRKTVFMSLVVTISLILAACRNNISLEDVEILKSRISQLETHSASLIVENETLRKENSELKEELEENSPTSATKPVETPAESKPRLRLKIHLAHQQQNV